MTFAQAFGELRRAGTAQNRKVYARHGVPEPMFGVSYADQSKLAKKAGMDHEPPSSSGLAGTTTRAF